MIKIISTSPQQTRILAKKFAKLLRGGEILALHGELGSGKTTFVKGLALGLGIRQKIMSPSFLIATSYKLPRYKKTLYHLDLYRIPNPSHLRELGFADILKDPKNITVIEWPHHAGQLPQSTIHLKFRHGKRTKERIIKI